MYLQVMEWGIVLWTWTIPLLKTHHHCKPHMVVQCPSSSAQQCMADHCIHIYVHCHNERFRIYWYKFTQDLIFHFCIKKCILQKIQPKYRYKEINNLNKESFLPFHSMVNWENAKLPVTYKSFPFPLVLIPKVNWSPSLFATPWYVFTPGKIKRLL